MSTTLDKTIARAEGFLKRFRERPVAHLIDGKADAGSGETFETLSPIDNTVIAQVARGGAAEIDKAVAHDGAVTDPAPGRKRCEFQCKSPRVRSP